MPKKYFTAKILKLFFSIVLAIVLIFFIPFNFFSPFRTALITIASPFEKAFYMLSMKADETFSFFGSIGKLRHENKELIEENNRLIAQIATLEDQRNENSVLRDQLELAPREEYGLVASFVIGQDPQKSGSWVMIDKGSKDGIQAGMPVIVGDGILIGRISETNFSSAKVALLSDSQSSVNAYDLETGAKGIIRGAYGLGLVFDMVNQTDVMEKGDTVVTSGLGGNVPKGLLIGKIDETKLTDDKLFQQAVVFPRIRYSRLDVVFVINNIK